MHSLIYQKGVEVMISAEKISGKRAIQGGIALMSLLAAVACSSPVKGEAQIGEGSPEIGNGDCAYSTVLTPDDVKRIVDGNLPSDLKDNLDPEVVGVMKELDVLAQSDDYPDDQRANQLMNQSFDVADKILSGLYADSLDANVNVYADILPDLTDGVGSPLMDGERLVQAVYDNCPQVAAES